MLSLSQLVVLSSILPTFSTPCFCPSDPAFVGNNHHIGVVVWNILMFMWVGAILWYWHSFYSICLHLLLLVHIYPFILVVACGGHYHMLLHVMDICLLIHQSLKALGDFVFGLKLDLVPRINLRFLWSRFQGRDIVYRGFLSAKILRYWGGVGAIVVWLLWGLDVRLLILHV